MAKKVTVSIPDMLYEKMERWRRSFNLSKMFQDAVAEAIQKKEDFQRRIQEDLDLGDVIERLRREKEQSEGNFYDAGKRDGFLWAKSASYDDILYALSLELYGQPFPPLRARSQPTRRNVDLCLPGNRILGSPDQAGDQVGNYPADAQT